MKVTTIIALLPLLAAAQLPPSPVGSACSAHGDHWDCEPAATATATSATTKDAPPSPSQYGCVYHGNNHWDCNAMIKSMESGVRSDDPHATLPDAHHDDGDHPTPTATEGHDHPSMTITDATLPPSPLYSANCKPHGNHWDCQELSSVPPNNSTAGVPFTPTALATTVAGAAAVVGVERGVLAVVGAAVAGLVLA